MMWVYTVFSYVCRRRRYIIHKYICWNFIHIIICMMHIIWAPLAADCWTTRGKTTIIPARCPNFILSSHALLANPSPWHPRISQHPSFVSDEQTHWVTDLQLYKDSLQFISMRQLFQREKNIINYCGANTWIIATHLYARALHVYLETHRERTKPYTIRLKIKNEEIEPTNTYRMFNARCSSVWINFLQWTSMKLPLVKCI